MKELISVFLGGGLGSIFRYILSLLIHGKGPIIGFPWATFTVNIAGSMLIGIFYVLATRFNLSNETRLFLTVGLCGGFTTFSTFSNESLSLFRDGAYGTFTIYILSSIILGILAVLAGGYLTHKL